MLGLLRAVELPGIGVSLLARESLVVLSCDVMVR